MATAIPVLVLHRNSYCAHRNRSRLNSRRYCFLLLRELRGTVAVLGVTIQVYFSPWSTRWDREKRDFAGQLPRLLRDRPFDPPRWSGKLIWNVQKSGYEKISVCVYVCFKTLENSSFWISGINQPIELKFGVHLTVNLHYSIKQTLTCHFWQLFSNNYNENYKNVF